MSDDVIDQMARMFVQKKRLLLTVEVSSEEEAIQLIEWMYAKDKPMKSNLLEVSWDKATVAKDVADAIDALTSALLRAKGYA